MFSNFSFNIATLTETLSTRRKHGFNFGLSRWIIFTFFLVLMLHTRGTESTAKVFINFEELYNPSSLQFDGSCCDGELIADNCTGVCDYSISVCLGESEDLPCNLASQNLGYLDYHSEVFTFPETFPDGFANPAPFSLDSWPGSTLVTIYIHDQDTADLELIDTVQFRYFMNDPVRERFQIPSDFISFNRNGTRETLPIRLQLSMTTRCDRFYYNDTCDVNCVDTEDCSGHYTCNTTNGEKICSDGWGGEECTDPLSPDQGCSATDLCLDRGTCVAFGNETYQNYYCCCNDGYTGESCQIDIDECESSPCQNDGLCIEGSPPNFTCQCPGRWKGDFCETPKTCDDNPCENGGRCMPLTVTFETFYCICDQDSFTGEYCEVSITTTTTAAPTTDTTTVETTKTTTRNVTVASGSDSETAATPISCSRNYYGSNCLIYCKATDSCSGHYTCDEITGEKICMSGWTQESNCTAPVTPDSQCACQNGGTCFNDTCCCTKEFMGPLCAESAVICPSNPCMNGGTCLEDVTGARCDCREMFTGEFCETMRYPNRNCGENYYGPNCDDYCLPQTQCGTEDGRYSCNELTGERVCLFGWSGEKCDKPDPDAKHQGEPCPYSVCRNSGTCFNQTCCCPPGYTGSLCHIEILECDSNPCLNNAICIDEINDYTCICKPGYTGKNCEEEMDISSGTTPASLPDPCSNVQCQNEGTCYRNGTDSFICLCTDRYNGRLCENYISTVATNSNCPQNFYGDDCGKFCVEQNSCLGHYYCDPTNGETICMSGWEGDYCHERTAHIEADPECPNPGSGCLNGGSCFNGTCCCPLTHEGKMCEKEILPCSRNPCGDNTTCLDKELTYQCQCLPGYSDDKCFNPEVDTTMSLAPSASSWSMDSKSASLSQNTHLLQSTYYSVTPSIKPTLTIETSIQTDTVVLSLDVSVTGSIKTVYDTASTSVHDTMRVSETINHLTTSLSTATSRSLMTSGLATDAIDASKTITTTILPSKSTPLFDLSSNGLNSTPMPPSSDNLCENITCENGGTCMLKNETDFFCLCHNGYDGLFCEMEATNCSSSPCGQYGVCVDIAGGYLCQCVAGYSGRRCETRIDGSGKPISSEAVLPSHIMSSARTLSSQSSSPAIFASMTDVITSFSTSSEGIKATKIQTVNVETTYTVPSLSLQPTHSTLNIMHSSMLLSDTFSSTPSTTPSYTEPCANITCENGGTCIRINNDDFICLCADRYEGITCQNYILEFAFNPLCGRNVYGDDCSVQCFEENSCNGHFYCDPADGSKICRSGWNGVNCDQRIVPPEVDPECPTSGSQCPSDTSCFQGSCCFNGITRSPVPFASVTGSTDGLSSSTKATESINIQTMTQSLTYIVPSETVQATQSTLNIMQSSMLVSDTFSLTPSTRPSYSEACANITCENGGTCIKINNDDFICLCADRYEGVTCQNYILEFAFNPLCGRNVYGDDCSVQCFEENSCNGHFYCDPADGSKICRSGWNGVNCDQRIVPPEVDPECPTSGSQCPSDTSCFQGSCCFNGITRSPVPFASVTGSTDGLFSSTKAIESINAQTMTPSLTYIVISEAIQPTQSTLGIMQSSMLVSDTFSSTPSTTPSYSEPCANITCENGGTCIRINNDDFICLCADRYEGVTCQNYILEFAFNPLCGRNVYGDDCSVQCFEENSCNGHFYCDPDDGSKICRSGWDGVNCDQRIVPPEVDPECPTSGSQCPSDTSCFQRSCCFNGITRSPVPFASVTGLTDGLSASTKATEGINIQTMTPSLTYIVPSEAIQPTQSTLGIMQSSMSVSDTFSSTPSTTPSYSESCANITCENGGTCIRLNNDDFICLCADRYEGVTCQNYILEFAFNPLCGRNVYGDDCSVQCFEENSCNGHFYCDPADGSKICRSGWDGVNCDQRIVPPEVDPECPTSGSQCPSDTSCFQGSCCFNGITKSPVPFASVTGLTDGLSSSTKATESINIQTMTPSLTYTVPSETVQATQSTLNIMHSSLLVGDTFSTAPSTTPSYSKPCENITCENGGTCIRINNDNFICLCADRYEGVTCQNYILEFAFNPLCGRNVYGDDCSVQCFEENSCNGHFYCDPADGSKICRSGWDGVNCDQRIVPPEADPECPTSGSQCPSDTSCFQGSCCFNGITRSPVPFASVTGLTDGLSASTKATEGINIQTISPSLTYIVPSEAIQPTQSKLGIMQSSMLVSDTFSSTPSTRPSYSEPCANITCENGGTCIRINNDDFICLCADRYEGITCQNYIQEFAFNPLCGRNVYGDDCSVQCFEENSCNGHFYCDPADGSKICRSGWDGVNCDQRIVPPEVDPECPTSGSQCPSDTSCFQGSCCFNGITRSPVPFASVTGLTDGLSASTKATEGINIQTMTPSLTYIVPSEAIQPTQSTLGIMQSSMLVSDTFSSTPSTTPSYSEPCANITCENGGTCIRINNDDFICLCADRYEGITCQNYILEFAFNPLCGRNVYGDDCSVQCFEENSCNGHFYCDPADGSKICRSGWDGVNCDQRIVPPEVDPECPTSGSQCPSDTSCFQGSCCFNGISRSPVSFATVTGLTASLSPFIENTYATHVQTMNLETSSVLPSFSVLPTRTIQNVLPSSLVAGDSVSFVSPPSLSHQKNGTVIYASMAVVTGGLSSISEVTVETNVKTMNVETTTLAVQPTQSTLNMISSSLPFSQSVSSAPSTTPTYSEPCANITCENGGTCIRINNDDFICLCADRYEGITCQNYTQEFAFNPLCSRNVYGDDCSVQCFEENSCNGHFYCDPADGSKICRSGWNGVNCDQRIVPPEVDPECPGNGTECSSGSSCFQGLCCLNVIATKPVTVVSASHVTQPFSSEVLQVSRSISQTLATTASSVLEASQSATVLFSSAYVSGSDITTSPSPQSTTAYSNTCVNITCQNGGTCVVDNSHNFTCLCPERYDGSLCENYINELNLNPNCPAYYYGDDCSVQCVEENSCNGHYYCDPSNGSKICRSGWGGRLCNERTIDPKVDPECANDGSVCPTGSSCFQGLCCFNGTANTPVVPSLATGFSLTLSDITLDTISTPKTVTVSTAIQPSQTTQYVMSSTYPVISDAVTTPISPSYTDPCANITCENGGTCIRNSPDTFICLCAERYDGFVCQNYIPQVSSSPNCPENYYGNDCSVRCVEEDSCVGHFYCNSSNGAKICRRGWGGILCDQRLVAPPVDPECSGLVSMCLNGGSCFNGSCCCPSSFTGSNCETSQILDSKIFASSTESTLVILEATSMFSIDDKIITFEPTSGFSVTDATEYSQWETTTTSNAVLPTSAMSEIPTGFVDQTVNTLTFGESTVELSPSSLMSEMSTIRSTAIVTTSETTATDVTTSTPTTRNNVGMDTSTLSPFTFVRGELYITGPCLPADYPKLIQIIKDALNSTNEPDLPCCFTVEVDERDKHFTKDGYQLIRVEYKFTPKPTSSSRPRINRSQMLDLVDEFLSSTSEFQRNNNQVYRGQLYSLDYVYETYFIGQVDPDIYQQITSIIADAWARKNPDCRCTYEVQLLLCSRYVGRYGTYLTQIYYTVSKNGVVLRTSSSEKPSTSDLVRTFSGYPPMNGIYPNTDTIPYNLHYEVTLNNITTLTSQFGANVRDQLQLQWHTYFQGNGQCASTTCRVLIRYTRPEIHYTDRRSEVSTLTYFTTLNGVVMKPYLETGPRQTDMDSTIGTCSCQHREAYYVYVQGSVDYFTAQRVVDDIIGQGQNQGQIIKRVYFYDAYNNLVTKVIFRPIYFAIEIPSRSRYEIEQIVANYNLQLPQLGLPKKQEYKLFIDGEVANASLPLLQDILKKAWVNINNEISPDDITVSLLRTDSKTSITSNGTQASIVYYYVTIDQADSSLTNAEQPSRQLTAELLKQEGWVSVLEDDVRNKRTIMVVGDFSLNNTSDMKKLKESLETAWREANNDYKGNVTVTIHTMDINNDTGKSDSDQEKTITFSIDLEGERPGMTECDLNRPGNDVIETAFDNNNLNVFLAERGYNNNDDDDDFPWYIPVGVILALLLVTVIIIVFVIIFRDSRRRDSKEIDNNPDDFGENNYDKEHFTMEPVAFENEAFSNLEQGTTATYVVNPEILGDGKTEF